MQFQLRSLLGVLCLVAAVLGIVSWFRESPDVLIAFIVVPYYLITIAVLCVFLEGLDKPVDWMWVASAVTLLALLMPCFVLLMFPVVGMR